MADYYQPTDNEWDEIDEWLETAHAEQGHLSADDVRFIAETFLPGRRLRLRAPSLGVTDWVEVVPQPKLPAAQRPPAAVQTAPRPAPPQPPQGHPNPAVEQARRDFQSVYGNQQGVKVITAADGYDHSGRVVDAHLNSRSHGDGLDEQARAEIAALPGYGEPGWGEAKRKLTQIRQAAGRRAAATQQAAPGKSERAAERESVAGFEGREDGTWAEVRRNAGNAFLSEWNREQARKWTPKL